MATMFFFRVSPFHPIDRLVRLGKLNFFFKYFFGLYFRVSGLTRTRRVLNIRNRTRWTSGRIGLRPIFGVCGFFGFLGSGCRVFGFRFLCSPLASMAFSGDHSSQAGATDPTPPIPLAPASWNPFSNSLTASLTLKLDRTNFLSWKSQVVPTVIGHDLDELLFTALAPPPKLINGVDNPLYFQWRRKDQLLLSWLRSSMTEGVLATVASYTTSHSVWTALEQRFASQSKARLLQLKGQLNSLHKGALFVSDYVDKVKSLCDSLAIAGHPLTDFDLVLHLLNGLGPEFDPVVSGITSRSDVLSLEEIQALLMSHEARLERHVSVMDLSSKLAANLAVGNRSGPFRPSGRGALPDNNSRFPNKGHGYRAPNLNIPLCQVCMRFGHTAAVCHYRFDRSWITPKTSSSQSQVHLTEQTLDYDPQAFVAQAIPDFGDDSGWFVDSGATNHVTYSGDILDSAAPYTGQETLAVANGKQLLISHIGHARLSSTPSSTLQLNSVLQVPSVTKNLVSVSRLTHNNNVFLEFHKSCCFVKDKETGAVLLKGKIKDGLYLLGDDSSGLPNTSLQINLATSSLHSVSSDCSCNNCNLSFVQSVNSNSSCNKSDCNNTSLIDYSHVSNFSALVSTASSNINVWHNKLGHPSPSILSKILTTVNIPHSLKNLEFCSACQLGKNHRLPFPLSQSRAPQPLALIHTDIWGPSHVASKDNFRY